MKNQRSLYHKTNITYFDVNEAALILKNLDFDSEATALASIVFPVPGGPNKRTPIVWVNSKNQIKIRQ